MDFMPGTGGSMSWSMVTSKVMIMFSFTAFFFKYDLICFKIMLLTGGNPHLSVPNYKC